MGLAGGGRRAARPYSVWPAGHLAQTGRIDEIGLAWLQGLRDGRKIAEDDNVAVSAGTEGLSIDGEMVQAA